MRKRSVGKFEILRLIQLGCRNQLEIIENLRIIRIFLLHCCRGFDILPIIDWRTKLRSSGGLVYVWVGDSMCFVKSAKIYKLENRVR